MMKQQLNILFAIILLVCEISEINSHLFENREYLDDDGNVLLLWDVKDSVITFEMEVKTEGFIALGISPNGSMLGSDIFIGGVNAENAEYYSDRFAEDYGEPKIDDQQDYTLIRWYESKGKTVLIFSRPLDTGDAEEDCPIKEGTTYLLWAYGDTDDLDSYNNTRRGMKEVTLIEAPTIPTSIPTTPPTSTEPTVPSTAPTSTEPTVSSTAPTSTEPTVPSTAPTSTQDTVPSTAPTATEPTVSSTAPTATEPTVSSTAPTSIQPTVISTATTSTVKITRPSRPTTFPTTPSSSPPYTRSTESTTRRSAGIIQTPNLIVTFMFTFIFLLIQ